MIRFFSKALTGAQLNWSTSEKECYGIYFGCKTFEDLLDNRHFILKTDHMNLNYLNVTLTGKVQRWKHYLQDKDFYLCHVSGKEVHQYVPDALLRLCENPRLSNESEKPAHKWHQAFLASIDPMQFSNKLLRYTTPWSATGASRSAESSSTIPRSRMYTLLGMPMPMLPSYESTKNPHYDASIHLCILQSIRDSTHRPNRSSSSR